MISHLRGTVLSFTPSSVTLLVGGVGYAVTLTKTTFVTCGQELALAISFCWHQEQGPHLYGFLSTGEKVLFEQIISCSGIGPKLAIALLGAMTPQQIVQALVMGDVKTLSSISGIGTKKAELLIMHLKDKVGKLSLGASEGHTSDVMEKLHKISDVLSSLNYSRQETTQALEYLKQQGILETSPFEDCLRKTLSFLAKRL